MCLEVDCAQTELCLESHPGKTWLWVRENAWWMPSKGSNCGGPAQEHFWCVVINLSFDFVHVGDGIRFAFWNSIAMSIRSCFCISHISSMLTSDSKIFPQLLTSSLWPGRSIISLSLLEFKPSRSLSLITGCGRFHPVTYSPGVVIRLARLGVPQRIDDWIAFGFARLLGVLNRSQYVHFGGTGGVILYCVVTHWYWGYLLRFHTGNESDHWKIEYSVRIDTS